MSLRVWMPLNGDLRNQGLSNLTATNSGATIDNNGKIGKCYSFNGTSSRISFPAATFSYPLSVCAWIKGETITASETEYIISYNTATDGTAGHRIGIGTYGGKLALWHGGNYTQYATALTNGIWYHVAAVVTATSCKLYLNGQPVISGTSAENSVASQFITLGARSAAAGGAVNGALYYFKGCINDFRLYDHALSAREVEEISKGLILHYKLDQSYNLVNTTKNTWQNIELGQWYSELWSQPMSFFTNRGFKNGDKITYSLDVKAASGQKKLSLRLQHYNSGDDRPNAYATQEIAPGNSGRLYVTTTLNTNYSTIQLLLGNASHGTVSATTTEQWKCLQLEASDIPTPWKANYGSTIVYDSSGYGNHGSIVGSLTAAASSPKFSHAMIFNGNNSAVAAGRGAMVTDAITVSCWGYMDNWNNFNGRLLSCTEYGGWNFEPASSKIQFQMGTGTSSCTYKPVQSTDTLSTLTAGWHFFLGTYDGLVNTLYIDGIFNNSVTAYTTKTPIFYNSSNGIFVGAEAAASATIPKEGYFFNGKISDVRIYATALNASQVADLYRSSKIVNSDGTVSPREVL